MNIYMCDLFVDYLRCDSMFYEPLSLFGKFFTYLVFYILALSFLNGDLL